MLFKNRYAAPSGDEYDGCGEFDSPRKALRAAVMALEDALPGTRWLGTRPWGPQKQAHAA